MAPRIPTLALLLLFALQGSASAQLTLGAKDSRLLIGTKWQTEIISLQGTLAANGIDVGSAGSGVLYNLTMAYEGVARVLVTSAAIPLDQAPNSGDFPDADYAIRSVTQDPAGTETENFTFMRHSAAGDVPVGTSSDISPINFLTEIGQVPWPIQLGSSWSQSDIEFTSAIVPELEMTGFLNIEVEVDGDGELVLVAGSFPALRLRQTIAGTLSFGDDELLAELGELQMQSVSYGWLTPSLGMVASIQETTVESAGDILPTTTSSQIIRLTEVDFPVVSAVAPATWATVKKRLGTLKR